MSRCATSRRRRWRKPSGCARPRQLPQGLRVTTHIADVSIEDQLKRFRDELIEQQSTDKIHLLFNNAGIGGGGSLFTNTREQWERTFNICWGGVYLGVRTFLPMLLKADEGHIVNTSSVNGFWASVGMGVSHTAYSAAKFAVKGFTEALIKDLRLNAPHIKCSVVMPGHIGTSIVSNSRKMQSGIRAARSRRIAPARQRLKGVGIDTAAMSDETSRRSRLIGPRVSRRGADDGRGRRQSHPRRRQGRALAHPGRRRRPPLDERVRQTPERAYEPISSQEFAAGGLTARLSPGCPVLISSHLTRAPPTSRSCSECPWSR